jgi:2-polyprenyl-6-hydroxyphenyl methylase/3-demethylubiquinone-9 3-methyltransferase
VTSSSSASDQVRFEFGANWSRFLECVDERRIEAAEASMLEMIGGREAIAGRTFLDAGSGSGLSTLAAVRLGAARVHSFDYDPKSVATTAEIKRRFAPDSVPWTVERGDILDDAYVASLGRWDVVYSWGVLHHTGRMWDAIANASELVADSGVLFIAIYNDQRRKTRLWKKIKRLYSASAIGRVAVLTAFVPYWVVRGVAGDVLSLRNPLRRYQDYQSERGMSLVHDWIDWLGGYPFETARPEEVFRFLHERGFSLRNLRTAGGGLGCNEFVFERTPRAVVHEP